MTHRQFSRAIFALAFSIWFSTGCINGITFSGETSVSRAIELAEELAGAYSVARGYTMDEDPSAAPSMQMLYFVSKKHVLALRPNNVLLKSIRCDFPNEKESIFGNISEIKRLHNFSSHTIALYEVDRIIEQAVPLSLPQSLKKETDNTKKLYVLTYGCIPKIDLENRALKAARSEFFTFKNFKGSLGHCISVPCAQNKFSINKADVGCILIEIKDNTHISIENQAFLIGVAAPFNEKNAGGNSRFMQLNERIIDGIYEEINKNELRQLIKCERRAHDMENSGRPLKCQRKAKEEVALNIFDHFPIIKPGDFITFRENGVWSICYYGTKQKPEEFLGLGVNFPTIMVASVKTTNDYTHIISSKGRELIIYKCGFISVIYANKKRTDVYVNGWVVDYPTPASMKWCYNEPQRRELLKDRKCSINKNVVQIVFSDSTVQTDYPDKRIVRNTTSLTSYYPHKITQSFLSSRESVTRYINGFVFTTTQDLPYPTITLSSPLLLSDYVPFDLPFLLIDFIGYLHYPYLNPPYLVETISSDKSLRIDYSNRSWACYKPCGDVELRSHTGKYAYLGVDALTTEPQRLEILGIYDSADSQPHLDGEKKDLDPKGILAIENTDINDTRGHVELCLPKREYDYVALDTIISETPLWLKNIVSGIFNSAYFRDLVSGAYGQAYWPHRIRYQPELAPPVDIKAEVERAISCKVEKDEESEQ